MNGEEIYDIRIVSYPFEKGACVKVDRNQYGNDIVTFTALPSGMKRVLNNGGLAEHVKNYKGLRLV